MTDKRVNPLHTEALTIDDVAPGDRIISWTPGNKMSVKHLEILSSQYTDADGYQVVLARDSRYHDSPEREVRTSEIGLASDRYKASLWHAIVTPEDQL